MGRKKNLEISSKKEKKILISDDNYDREKIKASLELAWFQLSEKYIKWYVWIKNDLLMRIQRKPNKCGFIWSQTASISGVNEAMKKVNTQS